MNKCAICSLAGLSSIASEIQADAELSALITRKFQIKCTTGYSLNAFVDVDPSDSIEILKVGVGRAAAGIVATNTLASGSGNVLHLVTPDPSPASVEQQILEQQILRSANATRSARPKPALARRAVSGLAVVLAIRSSSPVDRRRSTIGVPPL